MNVISCVLDSQRELEVVASEPYLNVWTDSDAAILVRSGEEVIVGPGARSRPLQLQPTSQADSTIGRGARTGGSALSVSWAAVRIESNVDLEDDAVRFVLVRPPARGDLLVSGRVCRSGRTAFTLRDLVHYELRYRHRPHMENGSGGGRGGGEGGEVGDYAEFRVVATPTSYSADDLFEEEKHRALVQSGLVFNFVIIDQGARESESTASKELTVTRNNVLFVGEYRKIKC